MRTCTCMCILPYSPVVCKAIGRDVMLGSLGIQLKCIALYGRIGTVQFEPRNLNRGVGIGQKSVRDFEISGNLWISNGIS